MLYDIRCIGCQFMAENYSFDVVSEFAYLGSTITSRNDVRLDIKHGTIFVVFLRSRQAKTSVMLPDQMQRPWEYFKVWVDNNFRIRKNYELHKVLNDMLLRAAIQNGYIGLEMPLKWMKTIWLKRILILGSVGIYEEDDLIQINKLPSVVLNLLLVSLYALPSKHSTQCLALDSTKSVYEVKETYKNML